MANSLIITQEEAINRATLMQPVLLNAKVHFLQDFVPSPGDNLAVQLTHECNFAGYPAGGYNSTVWTGPQLLAAGGAVLTSPVIVVAPNSTNNITNNVTAFVVAANNALTSNVATAVLTGIINPSVIVTLPTDQFPVVIRDYEGLVASPG